MTQKNHSIASGEPSIKEGAQGAENVGESAREDEEAGLQPPAPGAWTQVCITTPGLAKEHFKHPVARRTWLGDHPVHGGETHGPPGGRGRACRQALPPRRLPSLAVSHVASGSQGGSWKQSSGSCLQTR